METTYVIFIIRFQLICLIFQGYLMKTAYM